MSKLIPFLLLALVLVPQCRSSSRRSDQSTNSQPIVKGKSEKNECDFSKFAPMEARANYGSPVRSMPQPVYPPEARERGIKGRVSVLMLVNVRSGLVEQACILDGDAALATAAKDAAMKVKFAPYSSYIQKKYSYAQEIVNYNFEPK